MGRRARPKEDLDTELADLPPELRWREWMGRVEAVIFAAPAPVPREVLARVVGRDCNLDLVIEDSHSCYLGDRTARHGWGYGCGHCPACELRAKGFAAFLTAPDDTGPDL